MIFEAPRLLYDQGRIQDLWKGGGGAAATASAGGANVFGGSRLKTLFGISKGGAPPAPLPLNPLVMTNALLVVTQTLRPVQAYIGLVDLAREGFYCWMDGAQVTFTMWSKGKIIYPRIFTRANYHT